MTWETKKLGDIKSINFLRGNGLSKAMITPNGKRFCIHYGELYTLYQKPVIDEVISKTDFEGKVLSEEGDLLIPGTTTADAWGIAISRSLNKMNVVLGGDINILRTRNKELLSDFLSYFINGPAKFELASYATGTNIMHLSNKRISNIQVPIPPLKKQKEIVKILDGVFESISKSKENAEKNLKNAKELFESYLEEIFSNPKEDWEEKKFEKCLEKVKYTTKIQKKDFLKDGKYPIVSQEQDLINGYWNKKEDLFEIKKPVVIFGDHTQILKYIDFDFVLGADGVKILQPVDKIDPLYFYYVMKKIRIQNLGYARHYRLLKEKMVPIPPISEQKAIVQKLDDLSAEIKQLEEIYSQKLKDLEELKKSMLQKAFSGELTKE